jgi:hypothetical protein
MKRLVALLLLAAPLFAQFTPVPAERLRNNVLLGEHFELPAPGADWQWMRFDSPGTNEAFVVLQPSTGQRFILTWSADKEAIVPNEMFMKGMESGVRRMSATVGATVSDFASAPSKFPVDGASYRLQYKLTSPGGKVRYLMGYVGGVKTKFQIMLANPTAEEPPEFTKFAQGFVPK